MCSAFEVTPWCDTMIVIAGKDIASLSSEVREDLRQQLESRLEKICIRFGNYKRCIRKYLETKPVDIVDFCDFIKGLPVYECHGTKLTRFSSQDCESLMNMRDYIKVFGMLDKVTSFLNYHLLEYVIDEYKIERKNEELKYPDHLNKYIEDLKITEFIIIKHIEENLLDATKQLIIIMCCDSTCRLADVSNLRKHVAKIMNLDQSGVLIYDIGEGSAVVTFLIPTSVADFIFTEDHFFTPQQMKRFESLHIKKLVCNGHKYHFRSHVSGIIIMYNDIVSPFFYLSYIIIIM